MSLIKKQWELQKKQFEFMEAEMVKKVESQWEILRKNDFTGVFLFEEEVYHAGAGISKGKLDVIRKSPKKYYHETIIAPEQKKSDPLLIGNLVHTAILEPTYLHKRFVSDTEVIDKIMEMKPDTKKPTATKAYKDAKAAIEFEGMHMIKESDFEMARSMTESVFKHEKLQNILKDGLAERCVYAVDPETGLLMRCKPDYMLIKDGINFDIKTTIDASKEEFSKSIWNYRYFVQAAYYNYVSTLACKKEFNQFIFGCLEKSAPYDIAVYYIISEVIAHGEYVMREDLNTYAKCLESNIWEGYSRKIQPIDMPKWAYYKDGE